MELEDRVSKLEEEIKNLYAVLSEATATGRNAYAVYGRLENFDKMFGDFSSTLGEITRKIKTIMVDEKYVEEFTDNELKLWWLKSTMTAKELLAKVKNDFPNNDWDIDKINRCLCGKTKDLRLRSYIGKVLRDAVNSDSAEVSQG